MNPIFNVNSTYIQPCNELTLMGNVKTGALEGFDVGTCLAVITSVFAAYTASSGSNHHSNYCLTNIVYHITTKTVATAVVTEALTTTLGAAFGAATDLSNRVYCFLTESDTVSDTLDSAYSYLPSKDTVSDALNSALSYLPSKDQAWNACPDFLCAKDEL